MKLYTLWLVMPFLMFSLPNLHVNMNTSPDKSSYTIVIHGGAGNLKKKNFTPEKETAYRNALTDALQNGKELLENGASAIDVAQQVVSILEDCPLFNAGKGAVFSNSGFCEMDASIMDGRDLSCGAVSGMTNLKNPIHGARIVKDSTRHVFLYGERGQEFCLDHGAELADTSYFYTERRWKSFQKALEKDEIKLDHDSKDKTFNTPNTTKYGTVGCVVLDQHGNLAAATSTGGLTNKKYGRVGDSPIIGAGTYADNKTCAVSCTGIGEFFIRGTIARDVAAVMEYKKVNVQKAAKRVMKKLEQMEGRGGLIAVDYEGNYTMPFNTKGMYRAVATGGGVFKVSIFEE